MKVCQYLMMKCLEPKSESKKILTGRNIKFANFSEKELIHEFPENQNNVEFVNIFSYLKAKDKGTKKVEVVNEKSSSSRHNNEELNRIKLQLREYFHNVPVASCFNDEQTYEFFFTVFDNKILKKRFLFAFNERSTGGLSSNVFTVDWIAFTGILPIINERS